MDYPSDNMCLSQKIHQTHLKLQRRYVDAVTVAFLKRSANNDESTLTEHVITPTSARIESASLGIWKVVCRADKNQEDTIYWMCRLPHTDHGESETLLQEAADKRLSVRVVLVASKTDDENYILLVAPLKTVH